MFFYKVLILYINIVCPFGKNIISSDNKKVTLFFNIKYLQHLNK